jgi:hypothetical protein
LGVSLLEKTRQIALESSFESGKVLFFSLESRFNYLVM